MSSRGWTPKQVLLGRGEHDENTANVGEPGITSSVNCEFGIHGGVRGRPGATRETSFTSRTLDGSNNPVVFTGASFAGTGREAIAVDHVRDGLGERPLLITRGRAYTREELGAVPQWTDRLGVHPLAARRAASTFKPDDLLTPSGHQYTLPIAPHFGPSDISGNFWITSDAGELLEPVHLATTNQDVGGVARCGSTEAYVYVERGTSNLRMVFWSGTNSLSFATLATDAAGITGYGDAPCICCDFNQTNFFVSYNTTNINNVLKVLRVDTSGNVLTTQSVTSGVGNPITGTWITNTDVATNKLVLGWTDGTNGYHTKVYAASTLVDQAIDVLLSGLGSPTGIQTQIVVGAAQGGQCWYGISKLSGGNNVIEVGTRSLTTATSGFYKAWTSYSYTPAGGFAGGNSDQGASLYFQHQPIVFKGRVLLGLAAIRDWRGKAQSSAFEAQGATWYVYDITDLHSNGQNNGSVFDPVLAAHGPWEGSQAPWQCATAVLWSDLAHYSFQTVDWTEFMAQTVASNTALGNGSTAVSKYTQEVGFAGWDGLNVIEAIEPQVAHLGETTIIAGSAPRAIAGGYAHPLGFQFLGGPGIRATLAGGGLLAAGQYGWTAVWRWIDDRGQVHRSAPAVPLVTVGPGSVTVNSKVTLTATPPIFAEREAKVFVDFYSTDKDPVAPNILYYLQGTVSVDTANAGTTGLNVSFTFSQVQTPVTGPGGELLYTTGGIMENQPAEASGGVAVLGRRLWISDGRNLTASKLGTTGEAPSFNFDGPLTAEIPPAGGHVTGLGTVDGRVVALCSHGVFAVSGQGPDDTGQGPDFSEPIRLSEVACFGGRTVVSTPRGVIFIADHLQGSPDPLFGGPWILGRDGNFTALASRIQSLFDPTIPGNCTWVPEREWFVWAQQGVLIVWDMRTDNWSLWLPGSAFADWPTLVGSSNGTLRGAGGTEPCNFILGFGADHDNADRNITVKVVTNAILLTEDRLGWSKVRAISVLGEALVSGAHTLNVLVQGDDQLVMANANISWTLVIPGTWPTGRYAPTVGARGKASTVIVTLSATPGQVEWSALELQVKSLPTRAPSRLRG